MLKPSIPTASRKWLIKRSMFGSHSRSMNASIAFEVKMRNYFAEGDVPNSIRTNLSVNDLSWLELFAEANELKSMKFGYWTERDGFLSNNKVCYVILSPGKNEEANLIYMNLKYGSFEKAFEDYKITISRYK